MKLKKLVLLLPILMTPIGMTTGCGGGGEPVVIESTPMTETEEAEYEEETSASMDDESAN